MTYSPLTTCDRRVSRLNRKGFTLIELIVVIAILAILAAIAIPSFMGTLNNAKQKADEASANSMNSAIRIFQAEGNTMPTVTNKATFNTGFVSVLPDGVPAIQKTGNLFSLDTATWKVTVVTAVPTGSVNITT